MTAVIHFGYHAAHLEHFSTGTAAAQMTLVALQVALPLLALLASKSAYAPAHRGAKDRSSAIKNGVPPLAGTCGLPNCSEVEGLRPRAT